MKLISMTDKFKNIPEFEGFIISESGLIIRLPYFDSSNHKRDGKIVNESIGKGGYSQVVLRVDNHPKNKLVHRLVMQTFKPKKDKKLQVNHKDGNKQNNHVSNLEWVTDKQNKEHSVKNGLHQRGVRNGSSKLTDIAVRRIREYLKLGRTQKWIADYYEVDPSTISDIKNKKIWKHVN